MVIASDDDFQGSVSGGCVEADVIAMVATAVDTWGALHVLHNNAALTDASMHAKDLTVVDLDVETWDLSMAVNARGAMLACKHAVPRMIASGGGSIINTASNQGLAGDLSQTAYGAAKAAVISMSSTEKLRVVHAPMAT